jgi:glycosyltransferase involved in cell wall biosynthesis
MDNEIIVSIICNAFNQQDYIRNALDGFVMQQTDFPFEILVHDDASTDRTPQIIREYEEKYPHLFRPIYQTENQYSKRVGITRNIQVPRAKGKYIALCEGDDYWTDPRKLQKQVDAMEAHPEVDICAHRGMMLRQGKQIGTAPKQTQDTIFTPDQVILGGGGFVTTASLMIRRELFFRELPFAKAISLDYIWQISGSLRGGMLYLGECMNVYRVNAKGSWTARMRKDTAARIQHSQRVRQVMEQLDRETDYRYTEAIHKEFAKMDLGAMRRNGEWRKMLAPEGRKLLRTLPLKRRLLLVAKAFYRWLCNRLCTRKE